MSKQLFELSQKLQEKLNWDGPEVDRYLRYHKPANEVFIVSREEYDADNIRYRNSPTAKQFADENEVVRLYEKDFLVHKLPAETKDGYVLTLEQISDNKWSASYAKGDRKTYVQNGETAEKVLIKLALALHKASKL